MPNSLALALSQASANSNVSRASQSHKATRGEDEAIKLLKKPFDPHAYTRAVRRFNSAGEITAQEDEDDEERSEVITRRKRRIDMAAASQVPYLETYTATDGHIHRECAVTGIAQSGRLEVAHLIAREVGGTVGLLVNAGVLPEGSVHDDPWNRIPRESSLCHDLHTAMDHLQMSFTPIEDELLARLTAEIQYQKLRADDDPVRPPFSLFYQRLDGREAYIDAFFTTDFPMDYLIRGVTYKEKTPISWATKRTQDESVANADWPRPPPFRFYCSGNAVIAAMRSRVAQLDPAPDDVIERTATLAALVKELWGLWMLKDPAVARKRAERAATLLQDRFPNSPYTALLDAPDFTYDKIPLPSPSSYTDTAGYFIRAYENGKRAPLLRPLAIADDHDEASSASDESAPCISDTASSLAYPSIPACEKHGESIASNELFSKNETMHDDDAKADTAKIEEGRQGVKWELSEWQQEQQVGQSAS
ncbi:hypothetical protein NBRC10512v2_005891 [Rhodotorula toruloides]|uniref:Uncharacterized protein n=1 Tax=Rhodotorula toruloides (strain NP11) TaxID=1130832 RepID=M7WQ30_RHOT1|nr:uncharacterized protein RHTO_07990 [Rhodotorula toruloides NP11]EMS22637.1 hypothetical protein RHTO_07990 [Rhodotorula toruloides NP11]